MRKNRMTVLIAALACLASTPVMAYVGPGAGLTLLSALWGLLVAVLAAMAFLVVWPIRRWRRRRQASLETGSDLRSDLRSDLDEDDDVTSGAARRSGTGTD